MLLVDALLAELELFGVKQLFGIPGDFVLPLFEQLQQRNRLPLYYLSHEPSAVFAADAAARISNKPAAVLLTYGAGALNAVNAVAQAYVEHVPLVVIAGFPSQLEIDRGLQIHHQAKTVDSQRDIYWEITACQVRLTDPSRAGRDIRFALQTAMEQSRPVLIEVPRDAVQFNTMLAEPYQAPTLPVQELSLSVLHLADKLRAAKRPVILAGVDVRRFDAVNELQALALQLNIPFCSTLMGRACFDQHHPLYRGIFLNDVDQRPLQLLRNADLIIQIGVINTDSNFAAHTELFPANKVITIEQNQLKVEAVTYHHIALKPLLIALAEHKITPFAAQNIVCATETEQVNTLTTSSIVQKMEQLLSARTDTVPVISDIGDCLFASLHAKPSLMLAPAFYASMGYAVPAAIGVQAATGYRPVVLVGDGAFLMTGLELGHCSRYGFSPIVILFNNRRWDMIAAFSPELSCTALDNWHYADLARSMGGEGLQVSSLNDFSHAFTRALNNTNRFSLIEVILPPHGRSEHLTAFAKGFLSAQSKALASE